MPMYQVLRESTDTVAVTVRASSPEEAVRNAYRLKLAEWKSLGDGLGYQHIDSVTERRKDGKAYDVEYSGTGGIRCVEVRHHDLCADNEEG